MGSPARKQRRSSASAPAPPVAVGRVLREGTQADQLQVARDVGAGVADGSRGLGADAIHDLRGVVTINRRVAGKEGVKDRSQSINVGRRSDLGSAAARLLGRHVAVGAVHAVADGVVITVAC